MPETTRSVLRDDWKFFAVVAAVSTGFAGAMFAAAVALAGITSDPQLTSLLTSYTGS